MTELTIILLSSNKMRFFIAYINETSDNRYLMNNQIKVLNTFSPFYTSPSNFTHSQTDNFQSYTVGLHLNA